MREGYMQNECCPVWGTQSHKERTDKLMSKISTTGCEADPWPWAQSVAMPRHTHKRATQIVLQSTPLHPLLTDTTFFHPCVLRSDFYKAIKILRLMVYCLQIDSLLACEMPWWNMLHQPGLYPLINCRTQSMFSFKGKDSETTQIVLNEITAMAMTSVPPCAPWSANRCKWFVQLNSQTARKKAHIPPQAKVIHQLRSSNSLPVPLIPFPCDAGLG